jgi:deazaflavin-dependent oxidoreductase (nitroreductase family)
MEDSHDRSRELGQAARLPPRWFVRLAWLVHRAIFSLSGGRMGLRSHTADKWGMMRVTTTGRRSGEPRSVILAYFEDGQNLVTLAMNGWADPEPAWWLNLQANPGAAVELPKGQRNVIGRVAEGEERERLWDEWRVYDSKLDANAALRSGETAVVVLEPAP